MTEKKHLSFSSLQKILAQYFRKMPDNRQQSKVNHSVHDSLMSAFACMYFQDPSLLAFQQRLQDSTQSNNLKTIFGVDTIPKETQMREIVDSVSSDKFAPIFKDYFSKLQRAKLLTNYVVLPETNEYYLGLDATQYYSSTAVSCDKCLTKHKDSSTKATIYSHQALQPSIMHPDMRQVIPFMPEEIRNADGATKQDCEINAAKRLIPKIRQNHPKLRLILGGDGLYSKQPMIVLAKEYDCSFLFVAKPSDHIYMMDWLNGYDALPRYEMTDEKGRRHIYEWMNEVPLNGKADSVQVNFLSYQIVSTTANGTEKSHYRNSWVTDKTITGKNCQALANAGRCRWKLENEHFNTLKNQGYCLEHSYGHGKENLCFNFYNLTLLAFYFHQIFELTDTAYQACRKKMGSKREMWNTLRSYIKLLVFSSWQQFLDFCLNPRNYLAEDAQARVPP